MPSFRESQVGSFASGRRSMPVGPALLNVALSIAVYTVGVYGLLGDEHRRVLDAPLTEWHLDFGAALLLMVLGRFVILRRYERHCHAVERARGRRLAGDVYLVLYTIFGFNELIRLENWLHVVPGRPGWAGLSHAPENLRIYLIYGFIAVMAAHFLPLSLRRTGADARPGSDAGLDSVHTKIVEVVQDGPLLEGG